MGKCYLKVITQSSHNNKFLFSFFTFAIFINISDFHSFPISSKQVIQIQQMVILIKKKTSSSSLTPSKTGHLNQSWSQPDQLTQAYCELPRSCYIKYKTGYYSKNVLALSSSQLIFTKDSFGLSPD